MAVDDRRRVTARTLQVAAWRGRNDTVVLTPAPDRPSPTPREVADEVTHQREQGAHRILTGALHAPEISPFLANGFALQERLHLLRHDLDDLPEPRSMVMRRARPRDLSAVLDIDARAFDQFWTLDERGLRDAIRATPARHYRVAGSRRSSPCGYAVTGRAAERGYLQRLAVDPTHQREGVGRALVADSLLWLRRTGAAMAMVNTQEGNDAALELYRACGFVEEPKGLTVLVLDLDSRPTP